MQRKFCGDRKEMQIPRGLRPLVMTNKKSKSQLKPKEGLNGAPVNQSWFSDSTYTSQDAGEGARATDTN
jgi:hypothetical protein